MIWVPGVPRVPRVPWVRGLPSARRGCIHYYWREASAIVLATRHEGFPTTHADITSPRSGPYAPCSGGIDSGSCPTASRRSPMFPFPASFLPGLSSSHPPPPPPLSKTFSASTLFSRRCFPRKVRSKPSGSLPACLRSKRPGRRRTRPSQSPIAGGREPRLQWIKPRMIFGQHLGDLFRLVPLEFHYKLPLSLTPGAEPTGVRR